MVHGQWNTIVTEDYKVNFDTCKKGMLSIKISSGLTRNSTLFSLGLGMEKQLVLDNFLNLHCSYGLDVVGLWLSSALCIVDKE